MLVPPGQVVGRLHRPIWRALGTEAVYQVLRRGCAASVPPRASEPRLHQLGAVVSGGEVSGSTGRQRTSCSPSSRGGNVSRKTCWRPSTVGGGSPPLRGVARSRPATGSTPLVVCCRKLHGFAPAALPESTHGTHRHCFATLQRTARGRAVARGYPYPHADRRAARRYAD